MVWNEGDFALAGSCSLTPSPGTRWVKAHVLTHAQAVQRVADTWQMFDASVRPEHRCRSDDGEHVAIVYESTMRLKDGTEINVGSIEMFRVVAGKITEVWNCGYKQGVWN